MTTHLLVNSMFISNLLCARGGISLFINHFKIIYVYLHVVAFKQ